MTTNAELISSGEIPQTDDGQHTIAPAATIEHAAAAPAQSPEQQDPGAQQQPGQGCECATCGWRQLGCSVEYKPQCVYHKPKLDGWL